jgi:hypothetical protein
VTAAAPAAAPAGCALRVLGVAAWAPGLEDAAAWRAWSEAPGALGREGVPDARFLPALLRRRCTPLTRIMLRAAFDACPEPLRAEVRTVFASRHGSINESIELIEAVARSQPISPAKFSHTVHNAQAALYSIATGNRRASSSLAAQEDTTAAGWLEALAHLEREPERPLLLVQGDVPLAPTFAPLVDEPVASWAVAWLLAAGAADEGEPLALTFAAAAPGDARPRRAWPEPAELLRWWLAREERLELPGPRQRIGFRRAS